MRANTSTIRVKLLLALLSSVGMAVICMIFLSVLMILASASREFAIFFNTHLFLFVVIFLLIFAILTIVFFQLLIGKRIKYLEEITKSLDGIRQGNLQVNIPVQSSDELGKMAETVNDMAYQLKTSLEEERRLEKTKNDLITNVSHDLRTPLTSALGYLQLLTNLEYQDEEQMRKYSTIAYHQCNNLKVLIDDLFEFTKLSSPGIILTKRLINVKELLEQIVLGFMPSFMEAGIEYRFQVPDDKIQIEADPILLKRVFDNLISNAIKYGKEGRYLDVELCREDSDVVIRIINYGQTIPESDLPYIFEKFYRVDKSRTDMAGGSGLGLAIVKSIIDLHDGSITVDSRENRTMFEVRVPGFDG